MTDPMDVKNVHKTLRKAIDKQVESLLTMALLSGSMRGIAGAAVKERLREFVLAELEDTYQLIEKLSALGGEVSLSATKVSAPPDAEDALKELLAHESSAVESLHAVIPHSGQEPRSEALEHLLEHAIMRKQQQIDYLWHASDLSEPLDA